MMKFQVSLLIICFCYSVNGGPGSSSPPVALIGHVDTGFGSALCNCPGSTISTTILKPIPAPYSVEILKSGAFIGPNSLGYEGEDAVQCPNGGPCSPNHARLHVHLSPIGTLDVPDDERLAVYTTNNNLFCVRRLKFEVRHASSTKVELWDSGKTSRGECEVQSLPVDNQWHTVKCNWCLLTNGIQQILRLTIKFVPEASYINVANSKPIRVRKLKLWACQ